MCIDDTHSATTQNSRVTLVCMFPCFLQMAHAPGAKPVSQKQAAQPMGEAAGAGLDDELQVSHHTGGGATQVSQTPRFFARWSLISNL